MSSPVVAYLNFTLSHTGVRGKTGKIKLAPFSDFKKEYSIEQLGRIFPFLSKILPPIPIL